MENAQESKHADTGWTQCAKCAELERALREPWCPKCRREHAAEYSEIYANWVHALPQIHLVRAGVPPRFADRTLANFERSSAERRRAFDAVLAWARLRPGAPASLLLSGPAGTGKTHLACGALHKMLARRRRGRFVSVPELMLECRESYRKEGRLLSDILARCTECDSLLLDDLAAGKSTEFAAEVFLTLIDRAYTRGRPQLIVTTNLELSGIGRKLDERIADRLRELCELVKVEGQSYRRRIADAR